VREVSAQVFDALLPLTRIEGKSYFDLGCGEHNPYGMSALMYLNGAEQTVALDLDPAEPRRSAEVLADFLMECLAEPEAWNRQGLAPDSFLSRVRRFNLKALRAGDLAAGLAGLPLRHLQANVLDAVTDGLQVDLMSSRSVLEHVDHFPKVAARLAGMMKPGGLAYHTIDLVDHRAYTDPGHCHYWSFLAEGDDYNDRQPYGFVNRLRATEIRRCFEQAGFEILRYDVDRQPMPEGFRAKLTDKFAGPSDEELSATGVYCLLRKLLGSP
jgi:hypothetical protein